MDTVFAYSQNGTPVYLDGGHPHFEDNVAVEAIQHMVIPTVPADPTDRNQTRICETYDFCRVIGVNHRVHMEEDDIDFYVDRGIKEPRGYESHMVLKPAAPETKLTTVLFWYNEHWVLYTNFEGSEDPYCEPGTERWKALPTTEKWEVSKWYRKNPLSPTKPELEKAISVYEKEIDEEDAELNRLDGWIPSLEWNARDAVLTNMKKTLSAMKQFLYEM